MAVRRQHHIHSVERAARYEFRVWGQDLGQLFTRLREASELREIEDRTESYIVSDLPSDFNPKVRDSALDIRWLVKSSRWLDLWQPLVVARFPLSQTTLRDAVCPALSLDPVPFAQPEYDLESFKAIVIDAARHLNLVPVRKTRYLFRVEGCSAEFADVMVAGAHRETVAIESDSAAAALRAIARLGAGGRRNQSYPAALRAILAVAVPPDRASA